MQPYEMIDVCMYRYLQLKSLPSSGHSACFQRAIPISNTLICCVMSNRVILVPFLSIQQPLNDHHYLLVNVLSCLHDVKAQI